MNSMYRMFIPCFRSSCILRHKFRYKLELKLRQSRVISSHACLLSKTDSSLFVPVPLKINNDAQKESNVGEELTSKITKDEILQLLNRFYRRPEIKQLSEENGLDGRLFNQTFVSFRRYCLEVEKLPVDLHIVLSDILQSAGHIDDIFPYFLRHGQNIFPHLHCMDELKKISDLRMPANWYPEARAHTRRIIFHSGPTNSGKTYHALERFITAKSGVYCGPLKLLATEVYSKTNSRNTLCDLITGEERLYANPDKSASKHVACTVEMTQVATLYEVAVIDEIQMIRDLARGWAWTRALLGVVADEVHLCGESSAIELVKEICSQIGEEVEVRNYKRLTSLTVDDKALGQLENVQPGDCIVCFSKADIYTVSRKIEKIGHQCAVIYGGLPPGTKLAQANKFNDPADPCKVLVATDAIGMGLNLSIKRIIFYSLLKPTLNEKGEKEMENISTSQALQIGGRAGRYGTQFAEGHVTTFKHEDLHTLRAILERSVEPLKVAGLHPTADQIELYAYHLPHATLSNLMDIFVSLCQMDDSHYFMCYVEDFKFLADMIQHVPLPLRARYVFCCAPINKKMPFVCTMFLKFARQYSKNQAITFDWLCRNLSWPFSVPNTIVDLVHLEAVFDVIDCYLWLSYRFIDLFPDVELVRDMQRELDSVIQMGVQQITHLLKNSETKGVQVADEDSFIMRNKRATYEKDKHGRSSHVADNEEWYDDKHPESKESVPNKMASSTSSENIEDKMSHSVAYNRLTDRLLAQGLITPKELKELQKEWRHQINDDHNETETGIKAMKKKTKKRKTPRKSK